MRPRINTKRDEEIKAFAKMNSHISHAEIGRRYGLTRERIRQIVGNKRKPKQQ